MNPTKRSEGPRKKPGATSSFAKKRHDKTAQKTPDAPVKQPWRPLGQRRLLTALERAITHSLQWVVFELNEESLWIRVRAAVEQALMNEWKNGNLRGDVADQAFFVRCDTTTMTEHDIANARLVVLVGVACVKPSEFITMRVSQNTAG